MCSAFGIYLQSLIFFKKLKLFPTSIFLVLMRVLAPGSAYPNLLLSLPSMHVSTKSVFNLFVSGILIFYKEMKNSIKTFGFP